MTPYDATKQRGFSLAELMIAMTIGLLVTLAVGSLFLTSRQTYRQNDAMAKMQENARFAMELITQDLRHAGFFGNSPEPTGAGTNYAAMTLADPTSDCGVKTANGEAGLYNLGPTAGDRRFLLSFGNQIADVDATAVDTFYGACLAKSEVKPNSSILIIKRTAAEPTPPLLQDDPATTDNETTLEGRIANRPYVYATGGTAYLYTYTNGVTVPAGVAAGEHWEYQPRIYYIDNNDVLRRKQLQGLDLVSEPLAEGIEAIHIEFGINSTREAIDEGTPDYFTTPAVNTVSTANADMNWAISATVHILARTATPDPDPNYQDTRTYQLGSTGPTIGPLTKTDLVNGVTTATKFGDYRYHYRRRVYSTTVVLKNLRSQAMAE